MSRLIAALVLLVAGTAPAAAIAIDFEGAATAGAVTSLESDGFTFATTNPFYTLGIDDSPPAGSNGNALRFVGITPLVRMTSTAGAIFNLTSLDIHLDCGDPTYCVDDNWLISAYDATGSLINQAIVDPQGFVGWQPQIFDASWSGITRLELQAETGSEGSTAYVDNIQLNVVPVPAAVWLFGSALAGLGWLRRTPAV